LSGLRGTSYPEDLAGQKAVYKPLVEAIIEQVLKEKLEFDLYPRRGTLRGTSLPPCEVDLKDNAWAMKLRTEGARLSRAKTEGLATVYFNPCVTLATRWVMDII
jgi:hypothetical protein